MKIKYNGSLVDLKINIGTLCRFENAGFSIQDFVQPGRQIRAQVEMIRAAVDPKADQQAVADRIESSFIEVDAAIGHALVAAGIVPPGEDSDTEGEEEDPEVGNGASSGETSEPSPESSSPSRRKSLKASK